MKKPVFLLLLALCSLPMGASAKQAQLLLMPTRIVMGDKDRFVTVTVKNRGDATGAYRIELVDMDMPENGVITEVAVDKNSPYSAKPFLRISPRKMVLGPEESQNVRLLVRRPKDLRDGEYRTHLKVMLVEDNIEMEENRNEKPENLAIAVKSRLALIIPVIIRQGETIYNVHMENARLRYEGGSPVLNMDFVRSGNRSSMGDIKVVHISPSGKQTVVKDLPGVAVYRPTPRRHVSLPLDVPKGLSLAPGKLHITYTSQKNEGSKLLAEKDVGL